MLANATTTMVMEWQSRFPLSDVVDAPSIVYPLFWIKLGHVDKLTCHVHTLKPTFYHRENTSRTPLVYETNLVVLDATTLDQQLHWFAVAKVNNSSMQCMHWT